MPSIPARRLPRISLELSVLGFGGTGIGGLYEAVGDADAAQAVAEACRLGITYFDTAPFYGHGTSERRLGVALRDADSVVSTKVGRLLVPRSSPREAGPFADGEPFESRFDYSADGVRRSVEESLQRLGRSRVDILYIHDVWTDEHFEAAMAGAYPALARMRAEGIVAAIGAGIGRWEMCLRFARAGDFNVFMLANRYSLLEQGGALQHFLPYCAERGIGVVIGGPFNSGILATGAVPGARYNYEPADPDVLARVAAMESVCAAHSVPLAAAALQFPLGHPAVVSVVAGMRSRREVEANAALMTTAIPPGLWSDLKAQGLIERPAPVPAG